MPLNLPPGNFEDFWSMYVLEHQSPLNRALHFAGSSLALLSILAANWFQEYFLFLTTPIFGYSLAWLGHYAAERNRPTTFEHPLWSIRADVRMYRLSLAGKMTKEIQKSRDKATAA